MTEINLLPEELRKEEEKEAQATKKQSRSFHLNLSVPQKEGVKKKLDSAKPSLLSRLFARPITLTSSALPKEIREEIKEEYIPVKTESKKLHVPEEKFTKPEIELDFKTDLEKANSTKTKPELKKKPGLLIWDKLSKFFTPRVKAKKIKASPAKPREEIKEKRLTVDLIPEELSQYPELEFKKKFYITVATAFLAVFTVGASYLGIMWYQHNIDRQLKDLDGQITQVDKEIKDSEVRRQEAMYWQKRLGTIRGLLNDHIYWTRFFELLENHTIPEVFYVNFSMVGNQGVILSAVGVDYTSVAKQLVAFQKATNFVENVEISAASANISTETGDYNNVEFNINLTLKPTVFKQPIQ